jgi:hypothetical protein
MSSYCLYGMCLEQHCAWSAGMVAVETSEWGVTLVLCEMVVRWAEGNSWFFAMLQI